MCDHKIKPVFTYEVTKATADKIRPPNFIPLVGIICGTGLGQLADKIDVVKRVPFEDIPNFHKPTVVGHAGEVVFGNLGGVPVVCFKGRFHYYEGYNIQQCSMEIRVMKMLGVKVLIISNAAGGLGEGYRVGDLVLMKSHINFMGMAGLNPLIGPNDERFGPRFLPIKHPYCAELRHLGWETAKELGMAESVHEGTYMCDAGPNYETAAEIKLLKNWGVDVIGMSTVHEVITAIHCGMRVFGFSLVTNVCTEEDTVEDDSLSHQAISEVGNQSSQKLSDFVEKFCEKLYPSLKE